MATDSELWATGPAQFIKQQIQDQKKAEKNRLETCHMASMLDGVKIKDFAISADDSDKVMRDTAQSR